MAKKKKKPKNIRKPKRASKKAKKANKPKALKPIRKKGIELSINFIVVIILILVMFTSSVYIVNKFFFQAQVLHTQIDEQTRQRINALLNERDIVVLPDSIRTVNIGNNAIFELGVWNIGLGNDYTTFIINVTYDKGFGLDEEDISGECGESNPPDDPCIDYFDTAYLGEWKIRNTEKQADLILIKPIKGVKRGSHIFNVAVCAIDESTGVIPGGDGDCDGRDSFFTESPQPSRKAELYDGRLHKITIDIP